ncbi:MAG: amidohydrolase/deacetylase family metallohydrolase [Gammaproteobacteria bacterium]
MSAARTTYDIIIRGGTLIDPAAGRHGRFDLGISDGKVAAVTPDLGGAGARELIDASGKLVLPGMIDTHAHVYQHVTGKFGLNADLVGVRSGTTTLVDQGGPSCMTIGGFRHFVAETSKSRALCFISSYLVGGLEGHMYPELYGPSGVNVKHTVRAIEQNRDIVKGIKSHAEIGGASRWGLEVIKLGKEIARQTRIPLYIHLGQLWPTKDNADVDADAYVRELVPLMDEGDVLAHPFTRHPGGFVSAETGEVHPVIFEALERGVTVDVGHGSHFSFDMARRALAAGIKPFTLGADMHGYNVRMPAPGMSQAERSRNPFAGVAPFNLTIAMTELLALGLSLDEVVATVTCNPARMLAMQDELGTLEPGRVADVSVLNRLEGRFKLLDNSKEAVITDTLLTPDFCLIGGEQVDADSELLPAPIAA